MSNQNKVETYTYIDAYGTTQVTQTQYINNPYAYTGRELDDEDLYYYRARYYDPTTQRFLSEDPIGYNSGDFNFYRYVGNSPVNLVDPSGYAFSDILKQGGKRGWQVGVAGFGSCTILGTPVAGGACAALGGTFGFCGGIMEGLFYESTGLYDLKHDVTNDAKEGLLDSLRGGNTPIAQPYPYSPLPNGAGGPVILP